MRIKIHVRDVRILKRIQNTLHVGRIRTVRQTPYMLYIASSKEHMARILTCVNGYIRIKVPNFKKACACLNIEVQPAFPLKPYDSYLAGLIDSDGSVVLNFQQNCITVAVEVNLSPYVENLNFNPVIPYANPHILIRTTASGKKSIRFSYQTVQSMVPVYDYFTRVRLYSDFKFYRITRIPRFLTLRRYKLSAYGSVEYRAYSEFCLNFIMYQNPQWTKVPFVKKLDKHIVHRLVAKNMSAFPLCIKSWSRFCYFQRFLLLAS